MKLSKRENKTNEQSEDLNVDNHAIDYYTKEQQLSVFQKMCEVRTFEDILRQVNPSHFKCRIHLSSGQEAVGGCFGRGNPRGAVLPTTS